MLRDADLSLANWLEAALPPGTGVRFDAPRARWEELSWDAPFVSVFLCGIGRDGQHQPSSGWSDVRDDEGRLVGRQAPHRYHRLSYLVTAWAARGADDGANGSSAALPSLTSSPVFEEHDLLGAVIDACVGSEMLPDDHLIGAVAEAGLPVFVRCSEGDSGGSAAANPWPGLGIAPRAYLVLELAVPVLPPIAKDLAAPVRERVLGARRLPAAGAGQADGSSSPAVETVRRRERGGLGPGPVSPRRPSDSS